VAGVSIWSNAENPMSEPQNDERHPDHAARRQPLAEVNKSKIRERKHDPDLGRHGPVVGETAAKPTD
jgi:hypothetical protein